MTESSVPTDHIGVDKEEDMFRKGVNKVFDKIYDPRRRVVKRCIFVVSGSIKLRAALVAYDVTEQGRAPCTLSPWREEVFISRVRFFLFRLGGFNNIHPIPHEVSPTAFAALALSDPCTYYIAYS